MKRPPIRWQAFLWIAACGMVGYAVGMAHSPVEKTANDARLSAFPANRTDSRDLREEVDAFENFENLLSAESRETDIWKVVSRLPQEKIPETLLRLRETQAVTASQSTAGERLDAIESALYFHWAESDPQAALANVSAIPEPADDDGKAKRTDLVKSVLAAWMRVDPNEAYRAVKDHEDFGFIGRDMLVQTWNAENVFENLKLFPDKRQDLLGWYCVSIVSDESRRNAMLATLKEQPEMKDHYWADFMLFRAWGYMDFDAAMAEAEARQQQETIKRILQDNLAGSPAKAMPWATRNHIPPGGPKWEAGYRNWLVMDEPGARKWLAEHALAWRDEGHTGAVAGFLAQDYLRSQEYKNPTNQAFTEENLIRFMEDWKNKDPQAAGNWLNTAPEPARKLLTGKGAVGHE